MKFYLQIADENKVTDIITYEYPGYVEAELPLPLPEGSYAGIYEFSGGGLVYRSDWDNRGADMNKLINILLGAE